MASEKLQKEAVDRRADCKGKKSYIAPALQEAYFFAAPNRDRNMTGGASVLPRSVSDDAGELQVTIGIEQSEDFATTLINAFFPPEQDWVDLKPSSIVPDELKGEISEKANEAREAVFGLIRSSNFYEELAQVLNPDAAAGTFGMMISAGKPADKPKVLAVPLREIECDIGPDGSVDTRFAVRVTKARNVKALLKGMQFPPNVEKRLNDAPKKQVRVSWGYWRLWAEETEKWQHVVMVDNDVVHDEVLEGEGCCEFIVVRFNPFPESAYGDGPLLKAAPDLRVLDEMRAGMVDNIDLSLRPPMSYPDDSFANVEAGIEAGAWYPIRPGTEGAIKKMYEPNKLDAVYFDAQQIERRVKRMFYNDFPEQRGDTPPTATQWVDEMAMAQRRLGTPGLKFWSEGPKQIFARFRWIAAKKGIVDPKIEVGGQAIDIEPDNPARRAQRQQKVANAVKGMQIGAQFFPEEFKVSIDGAKTMEAIFDALDVGSVIVRRDENQIKQAVGMIQQLSGMAQPNTEVQPGMIGGPATQG